MNEKKKLRSIVSFVLTLVMVLTLIPGMSMEVHAADTQKISAQNFAITKTAAGYRITANAVNTGIDGDYWMVWYGTSNPDYYGHGPFYTVLMGDYDKYYIGSNVGGYYLIPDQLITNTSGAFTYERYNTENLDVTYSGALMWIAVFKMYDKATTKHHLITVGATDDIPTVLNQSKGNKIGGGDGTPEALPHSHDWKYVATDNEIDAYCANEGCDNYAASYDAAKSGNKLVVLTLSVTDADYSGSAVTASYGDGEAAAWKTAFGTDAPTITYEAKNDSDLTDGKAVNVGSYTAKASITVIPTEGDPITYNATADFTIDKAAAVVATAPTGKNNQTYSGNAQELATAGTAGEGASKLQYSLEQNGTYSDDIPTATDVGDYTVWYKAIADNSGNYKDSDPASVSAKINGLEFTAGDVTVTPYDGIYDGAAHGITINVKDGITGTTTTYCATSDGEYSATPITKADVGTYTVYYKVAKTGYNAETGSSTITINTKALTADAITITAPTSNGSDLTDSITVKFRDITLEKDTDYEVTYDPGTVKDAGNYTARLVFKGNYSGTVEKTFTVAAPYRPNIGGGSSITSSYVPEQSYTVRTTSASKVANGKFTVSQTSSKKDGTVVITVTPDAGYVADKVTVLDANGKAVEVRAVGENKYEFVMPGSKVTVDATFKPAEAKPVQSGNPFVDVAESAYYYDAVLWAAENGITGGVDATHFAPTNTVTRGQVVTFLWRAVGCPEVGASSAFADVAQGSYYDKAVAWAVANGITLGTSTTRFSPNATCTRGQIVTFLYRYNAMDTLNIKDNPFTDVAEGAYYHDAVLWAGEYGITGGTSATTFSPNSDCSRAQVVTFLWRYMGQ